MGKNILKNPEENAKKGKKVANKYLHFWGEYFQMDGAEVFEEEKTIANLSIFNTESFVMILVTCDEQHTRKHLARHLPPELLQLLMLFY